MKKKFALALALALTLSLTACTEKQQEPSPDQSVTVSTPEQPVESAPDESVLEQPVESAPTESTPEQPVESTPVEPVPEQSAPVVEPKPVDLFTDTNETVYAVSTVNIRSKPDTNSEKLGQLSWSDSVLRTGIDTASGWSEVQLADGSTAYISSKYLTTTKPAEQPKPVEQKPAEKPVESKPVEQKPVEQKPSSDAALTPEQEKKAQENLDVNIKEQMQIIAETAGGSGVNSLNDGLPDADGRYSTDETAQNLIDGVQYVEDESGAGGFIIPY